MVMSLEELRAKVYSQKELIPSLYGDIDFDIVPERFTASMNEKSMLPDGYAKKYRHQVLNDPERVERARLYTMLGDTVADRYAALAGQIRMPLLIKMLTDACDKGVENVPDAPQELVDFIRAMEYIPEWLDMELVEEGARVTRNYMANMVPFAIRGAFIATFMNKYSGLPMALTGALSNETSKSRINETATFFTTASLPGALDRFGPGFKAAAMVRLMHSMVRFNILKRSKKWDVKVYGIPLPQIDQMPAGTMPAFMAAFRYVTKGKQVFSRSDQATAELNRYQSYLLGLPEDLLGETPQQIFDNMLTYAATLREGYDDDTCGELTRATMAAYRPQDKSLRSRIYNEAEKGFSKVFFTQTFLKGSTRSRAKQMGVEPKLRDYLMFIGSTLYFTPRLQSHIIARHIPVVNELADRVLVKRIHGLLEEYGQARFVSDGDQYTMGEKKGGKRAA